MTERTTDEINTMQRSNSDDHMLEEDEGLMEALHTDQEFLDYVMSLPGPRPARQTSSRPTTAAPKVGLDHLDNLCRLMEQLSILKEQNSQLQRRVQYLEDLRSLHEMHREMKIPLRERSRSEDMSLGKTRWEPPGAVFHIGSCELDEERVVEEEEETPSSTGNDRPNSMADALTVPLDSVKRRQSTPSPTLVKDVPQDVDRKGKSLDRSEDARGTLLQMERDAKKRSAWGKVKTIIQTRKDSLKRRRIAAEDERETNKKMGGETNEGSKWNKVKKAFLSKREPSSPLQRSQSVPSSPTTHSSFTYEDLDLIQEYLHPDQWDKTNDKRVSDPGSTEGPVLPQDLQKNLAELQRNLSQEFNRKLIEWERLRHKDSLKGSRKNRDEDRARAKDLQWIERELTKLERDKARLARDKQKFAERETRLERLRRSLRLPHERKEVLVKTTAGEFRFQGISRSFARRLLEWEEKRGIRPEVSTIALLDPEYRPCSAPQHPSARLERNRSRSDSSIADMPREEPDPTRANSEPDLQRSLTSLGSYGSVLEDNLTLLESLKNKESICHRIEGQLDHIDSRLQTMINSHAKELDRYRLQLQKEGTQVEPQVFQEISCRLQQLQDANERLEESRKQLQVTINGNNEEPTATPTNEEAKKDHSCSKIPDIDVTKLQDLSVALLKQAQQLEEGLNERNLLLKHLRWELMEKDLNTLRPKKVDSAKPQSTRIQKKQRNCASLEGLSFHLTDQTKEAALTEEEQAKANFEIQVLSAELRLKVQELQDGLDQLWSSTTADKGKEGSASSPVEASPDIPPFHCDITKSGPTESLEKNEVTVGQWLQPATDADDSVKARRVSDTAVEYEFSQTKLDFASAFSTAIYDDEALETPSSKRNPPINAAPPLPPSTPPTTPSSVKQIAARFSQPQQDETASKIPCKKNNRETFSSTLQVSVNPSVARSPSGNSIPSPRIGKIKTPLRTTPTPSPSAEKRLPTRLPQSPRAIPKPLPSPSTPTSVTKTSLHPPSPPAENKHRVEVITRLVEPTTPDSPSRIPRFPNPEPPSHLPQSPGARARALKLRRAKDEFLSRPVEPPLTPSPQPETKVAKPRFHQPQEAGDPHPKRIATVTPVIVHGEQLGDITPPPQGGVVPKSGFFSFRFRKSRAKKKEVVKTLCRQSLLVDLSSGTVQVEEEPSPPVLSSGYSCPSSPDLPRTSKIARTTWQITKSRLFKPK